jgi:hypothetical protein
VALPDRQWHGRVHSRLCPVHGLLDNSYCHLRRNRGCRAAGALILTQRQRNQRDGVQDRRLSEHPLCRHLQHLPVVAGEFRGVEVDGPDAGEVHVPTCHQIYRIFDGRDAHDW